MTFAWKGGRHRCGSYMFVLSPGHPYADRRGRGYVREHRLVAEKALGKIIHPSHPVHHVSGDGLDNRPENLVVCENQAYHLLLHRRADALAACGNASFRLCHHCKKYDDTSNMMMWDKRRERHAHRLCEREFRRLRENRRNQERLASDPAGTRAKWREEYHLRKALKETA